MGQSRFQRRRVETRRLRRRDNRSRERNALRFGEEPGACGGTSEPAGHRTALPIGLTRGDLLGWLLGARRPTVQRIAVPPRPEASVAACSPEVKEKTTAWTRIAQASVRPTQSLFLRNPPMSPDC